jgi:cysteine synthase A
MVRLRKVVPSNGAEIFVKLEWENPTGSVKDRMALAVISRAEEDGRLKPGDTIVEYTGGSTGASLALVCAAKSYPIHIVSSDAFSREKLDQMRALGAQLTLVPSESGLTTAEGTHAKAPPAEGCTTKAGHPQGGAPTDHSLGNNL